MARKSRELTLKNDLPKSSKKKWDLKKSKGKARKSGRGSKELPLDNSIKIYCNAAETEPNYFTAFKEDVKKSKISDVNIEIIKKAGLDPLNAVKYVIKDKGKCSEVWIVFDKDHFEIEKAITLAENNDIRVAWSNESFELWFLLHFNYRSTAIGRAECLKVVKDEFKKKLKIDYAKNNKDSYKKLKSKMNIAIANAKRLYQEMKRDRISPTKANPCTTVFQLVEVLKSKVDR